MLYTGVKEELYALHDGQEEGDGHQEGEDDPREDLAFGGSVDARRLEAIGRHRLDACQENRDAVAEFHPDVDTEYGIEGRVGTVEELLCREPEGAQDAVGQAQGRGLEDPAPNPAHGHDGGDVGKDIDETVQALAPGDAVEEEGDGEAEGDDDRRADQGVAQGVDHRSGKGGIGKDRREVGDPQEKVGLPEEAPVRQAPPHHVEHGPEAHCDEEHQRNEQERIGCHRALFRESHKSASFASVPGK